MDKAAVRDLKPVNLALELQAQGSEEKFSNDPVCFNFINASFFF